MLVASGVTGTDRLKGICTDEASLFETFRFCLMMIDVSYAAPVEIEAYITELFQGQAAVGVFAYDICMEHSRQG